jgi:hypothetical protein
MLSKPTASRAGYVLWQLGQIYPLFSDSYLKWLTATNGRSFRICNSLTLPYRSQSISDRCLHFVHLPLYNINELLVVDVIICLWYRSLVRCSRFLLLDTEHI